MARPGSDPGLDALKVRNRTGYGDPTLVLEPVFVLGLFQKLTKEGMVEVNHRHQNSAKFAVFLAHVDRQVSLWDRRRLGALNRVLTQWHITRPGSAAAQRFGSARQLATPREQLRDRFVLARRGRGGPVQPAVSGSGLGF